MRRAAVVAACLLLLGWLGWRFVTAPPPAAERARALWEAPGDRPGPQPRTPDSARAPAVQAPRGALRRPAAEVADPEAIREPDGPRVSRVWSLRGAAIPDFEFEATRLDGSSVRVRTDATGAFDSAGLTFEAGHRPRRAPGDHPPAGFAAQRVTSALGIMIVCPDPESETPSLVATVGAALRIRLEPDPGLPVEELVARLRVIGSSSRIPWIATGSGLRGSDELLAEGNADVMHWGTAAAVHADPEGGYRALFGDRSDTYYDTPGVWFLSVESLDGSYFAESRVTLDRRRRGVLRWVDAELTEVRGRLLSIALHGGDRARPAAGHIRQLGLRDATLAELAWTSNVAGRQEFLPAPPGRYRLTLGGVRYERVERDVTFDARRNLHLDFDLERRPVEGSIRGRVRNAAADDPNGTVTLRLHADGGAFLEKRVRLQSVGGSPDVPGVALFAFPSLPAGTYRLEALSVGDEWRPLEVEAEPGDTLELVRRRF